MRRTISFLAAVVGGRFGRGGGGSVYGGRGRLALVVAVVFVGVMLAGRSAALAADPACGSATVAGSCTFDATGAEQTYTIPAGVTAVTITADGAPGGWAGARVIATVPLPPGTTTLYVEVGTAGTLGGGGFNGGGTSAHGGGGGGASDVRTCSRSACSDLSTDDTRLVVAGGGGGAGGDSLGCGHGAASGGIAGDPSVSGPGDGGSGGNVCDAGVGGGGGGLGGTGPGAAGANVTGSTCPGQAGAPPAPPAYSCQGQGGGGGGGYYGGGGGGDGTEGGGGGAGSSFWIPGATGTSMGENLVYTGGEGCCWLPGPPKVVITDGTPTSSSVTFRPNPSVVGQEVTLTAKVRPIPDGGTVDFQRLGTNGGAWDIAGCGSQPVDSSTGKAKCHVTFRRRGEHDIWAKYSGDALFQPNTSLARYQRVLARPSASIFSPANNQTFTIGKHVATSFGCREAPGGPGLSSCTDSNDANAPTGSLKTSTRGTFHYTVTATSKDGGTRTASITYTVK